MIAATQRREATKGSIGILPVLLARCPTALLALVLASGMVFAAEPPQPASQPATQPAFQPPPIDPAHQVLVDLIQKKPDLFALLELNDASDYVQMSEVLKNFEIAHQFLARNGWESDLNYVVGKLGEQKARIVLLPVISRVPASAERIHLVRLFAQAGCEVSLMPLDDSAHEHQRMLGRVANLVREGWSREEALKAVTLNPARLLGLDKRLGSIEKDKDADLILLDADPLDPRARVREVMILGEIVHHVDDVRQVESGVGQVESARPAGSVEVPER